MTKAIISILLFSLLYSCSDVSDNSAKGLYETIIIGGGLMGSSTAWHLSDQGNSILLLENKIQFIIKAQATVKQELHEAAIESMTFGHICIIVL